uniref:Uncharacterized protein n=1 Tax=Arundo donax TaxID=35708 RepID=A0A0A9B9E1_ARUDO
MAADQLLPEVLPECLAPLILHRLEPLHTELQIRRLSTRSALC